MSIRAVDFTIGTWPILIIVPLWALFIGPKFTPKTSVVPIEALKREMLENRSRNSVRL